MNTIFVAIILALSATAVLAEPLPVEKPRGQEEAARTVSFRPAPSARRRKAQGTPSPSHRTALARGAGWRAGITVCAAAGPDDQIVALAPSSPQGGSA